MSLVTRLRTIIIDESEEGKKMREYNLGVISFPGLISGR